tara:strand:- start:1355 stop:2485 length:1131 start_codon:yes stop_codon:yes gene_type:complete
MRICQIHNEYLYKGGEDNVVEAEKKLLEKNGHNVFQIVRKNYEEIRSIKDKFETLNNLAYSKKSLKILDNYFLQNQLPDIVHIHNIFPLWTYSIFEYFKLKKIPMVMTLHNFRLLWENVGLFNNKDNKKYGLFKNSLIKTFILQKIIDRQKKLLFNVDKFIALNEFAKKQFISVGLPSHKIEIKQNFLENDKDNQTELNERKINNKIKFISTSRLSDEKGVNILFETWKNFDYELALFGEGPLLYKSLNKNIKFFGNQNFEVIKYHMNESFALILPSKLYEGGLPLSIIEAFKNDTLVIASNLGSMKSEIKHEINGLLFNPNDSKSLQERINWAVQNKDLCKKIVVNAKNDFLLKYTEEKNYNLLIAIYKKLILNK